MAESTPNSPKPSRTLKKKGEYTTEEIARSLQNLLKDTTGSKAKLSSESSVVSSVEIPLPPPTPKKNLGLQDISIYQTLGTGSFGRVHLVKLKEDGKYYALKVSLIDEVLKKADVVKLRQVEHTLNEKKILDKLNHPFLVSMISSFQDSAYLYFVLEYIQGGELFSYLRKSTRFPNHVTRFYAAEVVLAFEYLHSMNIIYRDLKPENILINAQGHIKLTDYGFAKVVTDQTWTLCGTPDYLAPEIIQSKGYTKAVDWWALGILVYEMAAGFPPFYHEDPMKLYENILQCKPRFPSTFDPLCKDLVKSLLVADLSKRYGNLKGGVKDIKNHKWFTGIEWSKLVSGEVAAPYVPPIKSASDTSQFDKYPETDEKYGVTGPDPYHEKFKEF